jgi:hypothetical protein
VGQELKLRHYLSCTAHLALTLQAIASLGGHPVPNRVVLHDGGLHTYANMRTNVGYFSPHLALFKFIQTAKPVL